MIAPGEITTDEFAKSHPELHHYTTLDGFVGIVGSNTLWATHYQDLNDTTELVHLRDSLIGVLAARYQTALINWRRGSLKRARQIERQGSIGHVARGLAADLIDALYNTAFSGGSGPPMAVPFVSSFCSHASDLAYERHNGLLSQWRGYGAKGGVCIVFDTAAFADLLREAYPKAYWVHLQMAAVEYSLDRISVDKLFPELIASCEGTLESLLENRGVGHVRDSIFTDLVDGASRYKHRGFFEEREVRVVAIPAPAETLERMKELHPGFEAGPLVPVRERERSDRRVRYIALLEPPDRPLPIKRVIIGPSASQDETEAGVRKLSPEGITIHRSETPFI
jgi:hypothetical protein